MPGDMTTDGMRPGGTAHGSGSISAPEPVTLPQPGSAEEKALIHSFDFDQLNPVDSEAQPGKFPQPVPSRADMDHLSLSDNDVIARWGNLSAEQEAHRQSLPPDQREQFDATLVDSLRLATLMQTDGPLPPDLKSELGSICNALFSQADPSVPFPGPPNMLTSDREALVSYGAAALGEGGGEKMAAVLDRLGPAFSSDPSAGPDDAAFALTREYEKTHPGYWFPEGDSRRGPVLPAHPSNTFETLSQNIP